MPRAKRQHLKQRKDGRYRAVYNGIQFMGASEEEALEAREAYKRAEIRGESWNDKGTTVYEYALKWLPVHKASVATNTYNAYAGYLNKLVSKIGRMEMASVSPSDIKDVYNLYLGQSDSQIRKARMLYVDMWDCAIEDGVVSSNPCRAKGARPHHGSSGSHRALSREEDNLILTHENKLRLAVLLMRYAGLRRGEAMAFDLDKNVDYERNIIIIRSAIHFEGNAGKLSDPKTEAGKREIPLLGILRNELIGKHGPLFDKMSSSKWRSLWSQYINSLEASVNHCPQKRWFHKTKAWIAEHPDEYVEYERLKKKSPDAAEAYRLREWKSVSIRPHDLRHSYCTMLRDAGVDVKLAIRWMGHADEKMILRIYDHPSEMRIQSAISSLNNLAFQVQNEVQGQSSVHASIDNPCVPEHRA